MDFEELLDKLTNRLSIFGILNGLFIFTQGLTSTKESKLLATFILVFSFFIFFSIIKTIIKNFIKIHLEKPNIYHFEYYILISFVVLIFLALLNYYIVNAINLLFGIIVLIQLGIQLIIIAVFIYYFKRKGDKDILGAPPEYKAAGILLILCFFLLNISTHISKFYDDSAGKSPNEAIKSYFYIDKVEEWFK